MGLLGLHLLVGYLVWDIEHYSPFWVLQPQMSWPLLTYLCHLPSHFSPLIIYGNQLIYSKCGISVLLFLFVWELFLGRGRRKLLYSVIFTPEIRHHYCILKTMAGTEGSYWPKALVPGSVKSLILQYLVKELTSNMLFSGFKVWKREGWLYAASAF